MVVLMTDKITYTDVKEYENLFSLVPPFLLEAFAKKNTNFVLKFKSQVQSHIDNLSDKQKTKLDLILNSDIDELQSIMSEAYLKSRKKQYKILSNPKYKEFIRINLNSLDELLIDYFKTD